MTGLDPHEMRQRLRAARAYADFNLDEMASAIGIGRNTIVRMEAGERLPKTMELREYARVCELPYEFFTEPFEKLERASLDDPLTQMFLRAGAKFIAATGQVALMPDHPLYDDWVAVKPLLEKVDGGEELTDEELTLVGDTVEAIAAAAEEGVPPDDIRSRLERLESTLSEFADAWREQGLPAAALIQAHFGELGEEDEATEQKPQRADRPAAER